MLTDHGMVVAVSRDGEHRFSNTVTDEITLLPGQMGENILTAAVELFGLPRDTLLQLREHALVQVTGLRNPCAQIDAFQRGLLKAVIGRDQNGHVVRKAGVMAIVVHGGPVRPGGSIQVRLPTGPHRALERV